MEILLGCDPELFVRDKKTGLFKSAHDLIPGTKSDPHKVACGAIQRDGVAAEVNIDPTRSREQFLIFIRTVMGTLRDYVGPKYELVAVPTAVFDQKYFDSLPNIPKELGCTPDYNAYSGKANIPPETTEPFRTGAGHIHIGIGQYRDKDDPEIFAEDCNMAKQLDAVLFFASLLWDNDEKRRELYGNIGAFRPKPYGFEWRPMSNAWLNDDDLILWVYDAAKKAIELLFEGKRLYETIAFESIFEHYFERTINLDRIKKYMSILYRDCDIPVLPEKYR